MKKKLPKFKTAEAEAIFWEKHDILDYVSADEFQIVNPNASSEDFRKPKRVLFTMRMDPSILESVKKLAHQKNMSYQQMMRDWIEQKIKKETK
jgi:predicted DNA binding CopG/RHH family protein